MSDEHKPDDRDNSVADSGYGNSLIHSVAETSRASLEAKHVQDTKGLGFRSRQKATETFLKTSTSDLSDKRRNF